MTDHDKALVERLERIVFITEGEEISDAISRIKAQAAEIEYWKTEARNVRRELKSEQKQTDNAMDNYDAMQRRCEAQAAEIEKLREALHEIDIEAANTIPRDGKDAAFATLFRIAQIINPFRLTRAALGETK